MGVERSQVKKFIYVNLCKAERKMEGRGLGEGRKGTGRGVEPGGYGRKILLVIRFLLTVKIETKH